MPSLVQAVLCRQNAGSVENLKALASKSVVYHPDKPVVSSYSCITQILCNTTLLYSVCKDPVSRNSRHLSPLMITSTWSNLWKRLSLRGFTAMGKEALIRFWRFLLNFRLHLKTTYQRLLRFFTALYGDITVFKRFPFYWPLYGNPRVTAGFPTKCRWYGTLLIFCCLPEQTIAPPVMWDTLTLMWRHCRRKLHMYAYNLMVKSRSFRFQYNKLYKPQQHRGDALNFHSNKSMA